MEDYSARGQIVGEETIFTVWKKTVKPPEFTLKDVTISKALPFLSVTITPDVYLIEGINEQTVNHRIENESPFPVVVKVLATAPRRFGISKNNFFIDKKSSTDVEDRFLVFTDVSSV
ncbi:hypothetical protein OESDEN_09956 [Oesophagostomum dentatum]|uniref:MSP domain-containing protein n=1 Tax=Oesophagostomum dentatum TaxID=61180 RepID=A0A0B1T349_OESDE|nr:hypothetical protein OESDEN_09956 [Oesophagostomum dentatum]